MHPLLNSTEAIAPSEACPAGKYGCYHHHHDAKQISFRTGPCWKMFLCNCCERTCSEKCLCYDQCVCCYVSSSNGCSCCNFEYITKPTRKQCSICCCLCYNRYVNPHYDADDPHSRPKIGGC
eukprot:Awhi_evm1s8399